MKKKLLIAIEYVLLLTSLFFVDKYIISLFNNKLKLLILITFIDISITLIYLYLIDNKYIMKLTNKLKIKNLNLKVKKIIILVIALLNITVYPTEIVISKISLLKSANYGFKKYSTTPVLGNSSTASLFDPQVVKENDKYKMYVSYRKEKAVAISTSEDGINWSELKIVLKNNTTSGWEDEVNRATVLYHDGLYYMYYTGQANNLSKIGLAISKDGINFERYSENPILEPELNYEKSSVMNPYVFYDEEDNLFKMYYAAGETYEPDVIAYATSEDGINWIKYISNPILTKSTEKEVLDNFKVGACEVYKMSNDYYLMFYIGYSDIHTARIFYASSNDGINWNKKNSQEVISGTKNGFDSEATYKPTLLYEADKDKWMLWYNGRTKHNEYIGYAECNNCKF